MTSGVKENYFNSLIKNNMKTKQDRLNELYDRAIGFYLDKSDFDVSEWLIDEDREEYAKLYQELNGECPFCGESSDDVSFTSWGEHKCD